MRIHGIENYRQQNWCHLCDYDSVFALVNLYVMDLIDISGGGRCKSLYISNQNFDIIFKDTKWNKQSKNNKQNTSESKHT